MDDIRSLENQIQQLQAELNRQNREMNAMRQRTAKENHKRLTDYEKQMEKALKQHDKAAQKEYERLLLEYQKSLNQETQEAQLRMNEEYRKLRTSVDDKEREWKEKNKQLERMISDLKKNSENKDQVGEQEAAKYMSEAGVAQMDVERKPHEKFFPRRINAFRTAISDASELNRRGLREAAIAIYISARSGLNRLGFDVDEKYSEWEAQYNIFKTKVKLLETKLNDEYSDWMQYALNTQKSYDEMSDEEKEQTHLSIAFWSAGEFNMVCDKLAAYQGEVEKIEDMGPMEYLRAQDSMDIDAVKNAISDIDKLSEGWNSTADLYKAKYQAACERADWGENIIDFLEGEINLVWNEKESHFKEVDSETSEKPEYKMYMTMQYGDEQTREDTRQWLELVFNNSMETVVFVYIVPYEKGVKVENRIVLYIDYNGAVNEEYSRHIYKHICESIRLEDDDGTINFASSVNELSANTNKTLRETGKSIEKKMNRMR